MLMEIDSVPGWGLAVEGDLRTSSGTKVELVPAFLDLPFSGRGRETESNLQETEKVVTKFRRKECNLDRTLRQQWGGWRAWSPWGDMHGREETDCAPGSH